MKNLMKNAIPDALGRTALAFALFCGLAATAWNALALGSLKTAGAVSVAVGGAVCILLCAVTGKRARRGIYALLAVALAVTAMFASGYISDGWSIVFNRIFSGFELRYGRIFPYFKSGLTEGRPDLCAAVFLVFPTVPLAVCAAKTVCARTVWRFAFPVFAAAIWAGAAVFRLPVPGLPPVLFGLAAVGMRARSVMLGAASPDGGKAILPVMLALALIAGVFALPAALIAGGGERDAAARRGAVAERIHGLRYHVSDSAMPEGDFRGLGGFEPSDSAALYVTADDPKPMYLRGWSGGVYTGSGWEGLGAEALGKYASAFSWMHSADFFGQTQYAALADALGISGESGVIKIENVSACAANEFSAYELTGKVPGANAVGDVYVKSAGLRGEREYTLNVSDVPIERYGLVYDLMADAGYANVPEVYEYLRYEGAYRDFVYGEYLAVPRDAHGAARRLLAPLNLPEGAKVSFAEAQRIVLYCLLNDYEYSETPGTAPADRDFAVWFLEESRSGYSPHFATAAALLFRELGFPTRYAEGYVITAEDILAADGGRIEVPESRARAWVEIYRDGVGFIPFEVTPPFIADSPYTPPPQSGGAGSSGIIEPPTEEPEEPAPRITLTQILLILLAVLLFLLIAAAAYLFIRRRVILKRRGALLNDPDNAEAVCWTAAYAASLLAHLGIPRRNGSLLALVPEAERMFGGEFAAEYENAAKVFRAAAFDPKPLPDEHRAAAGAFAEDVLKLLKTANPPLKKLRLKWILCVW
ncbi:MAG: transglutaminase-like domain-containing protein [Oscillospiraceae bacterium]|jgi:transglutaminase-like putative cysteine protease|nr:transglutaminase-like domain-containing protein [Oscillospiraceae bacterium]